MSAFSLDKYVRDIIHHYLTSSRLTVSAVLDRKSSIDLHTLYIDGWHLSGNEHGLDQQGFV